MRPPGARTPHTRRRRRMAIAAGALLVLLGVWAFVFFRDAPPPEYSDLRLPPPATVLPGENASLAWDRAPRLGDPPGRPAGLWQWAVAGGLPTDGGPDTPLRRQGRAWLEENREAIEGKVATMDLPGFSGAHRKGAVPPDLIRAIHVLETAAGVEWAEGSPATAWRWLEAASRWHRENFAARTLTLPQLLSHRTHPLSLVRLHWALAAPDDLSLLQTALEESARSELPEEWRRHLLLLQFEQQIEAVGRPRDLQRRMKGAKLPGWVAALHRPHRSQQLLVEGTRRLIDAAANGETRPEGYAARVDAFLPIRSTGARLMHAITGNLAGVILVRGGLTPPSELGHPRRLAEAEFCSAALRTVLALRVHRLQHGTWPADLDALVPQLLPELPLDPESPERAPLLYDRDRGLIFGVGENGRADGGAPPPGTTNPVVLAGDDRTVRLPGFLRD